MHNQLLRRHLLLGVRRGRGRRSCGSSLLLGTVSADMPGLLASEAQSFLHELGSLLGGHRVDASRDRIYVHCVRIFPRFEGPFPRGFGLLFLVCVSLQNPL